MCIIYSIYTLYIFMYIYIYRDGEERERERLNLVDLTFYVNFISIKYKNPLFATFCLSF